MLKLPKRMLNLPKIPAGRHYLLMVYGYWAKGETLEKAYQNLRATGATRIATDKMIVYHVQPDAQVDSMGSIWWSGDEDYEKTRSVKIAELNRNTRTLFVTG